MKRHIEKFWRGWGRDMRKSPPAWPPTSAIYRVWEQGAMQKFGPRVPRIEYSDPDFYRANNIWQQMPETLRRFTFVFYAQPWRWQEKCRRLGISRHRLYRLRDRVHDFTEARL